MDPITVILVVLGYFAVLMIISLVTGKSDDSDAFFRGDRKSPWYVVAFGMIGASLSGVTFISVPGWVKGEQFSYMQMVLGFLVGYFIIAYVLLPLYYRLNLTSIYTYLNQRFGKRSYKTGATCFLISRIMGAAFRLYLVAIVFQEAVFEKLELQVPFELTVVLTVLLIWLYTYKGGIKTIIWTDTLQTTFMLISVVITIMLIANQMELSFEGLITKISDSSYSKVFFFEDWRDERFFFKKFIAGVFMAIVMTGLDQDMMQKNLTCKNLKEGQKNMISFSLVLVVVNLVFLSLGALLYIYTSEYGIKVPIKGDQLFSMVALDGYLGASVALFFILGLVAAAYSSADSALTSLTTSFCVDFLDIESKEKQQQKRYRRYVHIGVSIVLVIAIIVFKLINDDNVISQLFKAASYTYGPLLGLFAFGIIHKVGVKDKYVPYIAILSPVVCYIVNANSIEWLGGYNFSFELLLLNGLITYLGLWLLAQRNTGRYNYEQ